MSDEKILNMREKDFLRFAEKIEDAVNELSLENYLNMPDFIIGEMMAKYFDALVGAYNKREKWHSKERAIREVKPTKESR